MPRYMISVFTMKTPRRVHYPATVWQSRYWQQLIQCSLEKETTFSVALAAIQGGWSKILSTCFELASDSNPLPSVSSVKEECKKYSRLNGKQLGIEPEMIKKYVEAIENVEPPAKGTWISGIDATNTPKELILAGKVAWFQGPWMEEWDTAGAPPTLVTNFLEHMVSKQKPGDYVLIGIANYFPFIKRYRLGDMFDFKEKKLTDKYPWYDFLGIDDSFIKKVLQFGYHHQCCNKACDIHEIIMETQITLIFKKK